MGLVGVTDVLALHGGPPVRTRPFARPRTIGNEEKRAVLEVLESGALSQFVATWGPEFNGGPRVRELERAWAERFGVKHVTAVNSATSGLYAAVGALDVGPGDEVIVTPFTMSASATGIIVYGGVPVFADILSDTFCLDPESVRQAITARTKAIIVVDLFGHPAEMDEINAIAREHGLAVIEDAAQAPDARYRDRSCGTLGDIGVFSLNQHKTIQCGEGGLVVTNDDDLAERVRLIRNHAEVIVKDKGDHHLAHLVGFNYRMTEIEAAIAVEQLRKLSRLTEGRIAAAALLTRRLSGIPSMHPPVVRPYARHVYYMYAIRYDAEISGVPRDVFVKALKAEGIPVTSGYVEPIYLQPLYHAGRSRWQTAPRSDGWPPYGRGTCPVAERMHFAELINTDLCFAGLTEDDADDIGTAVEKVLRHADELGRDARTVRS